MGEATGHPPPLPPMPYASGKSPMLLRVKARPFKIIDFFLKISII